MRGLNRLQEIFDSHSGGTPAGYPFGFPAVNGALIHAEPGGKGRLALA